MKVLVAGAGGFIGGHLVKHLLDEGHSVKAVDKKFADDWYQWHMDADNWSLVDLSSRGEAFHVCEDMDVVYNLAADMGGMGFIENNKALCMLSVLINTHLLMAARAAGVQKYFFASSACVYSQVKQRDPEVTALTESDAYPADAEDGYGWEKLFSERMCRHFHEDFGLDVRVARFHNVYGPCLSSDTEVLTEAGWKPFPWVTENDSVATLNPDTGFMEYHRPLSVQRKYYTGPMYRVAGRSVDTLVTPDHRIYISTPTTGTKKFTDFRLTAAQDSQWDRNLMVFSCEAKWEGVDFESYNIPSVEGGGTGTQKGGAKSLPLNTWLDFVGWYVSEGSSFETRSNRVVCVTQNPGPKQEAIIRLVKEMGFSPYVQGRDVKVNSKQLYLEVQQFGRGAKRKSLPQWLLGLPPHRLKVLFNSLMAGDGDSDRNRYTTSSGLLAAQVQEIALKLGKRAWVSEEGSVYRVHISDRVHMWTRRANRTIEEYDGMVYDLTIPNHVFMVRRNGKPQWTGNCGTFRGGREKAPAAICRKVIEAKQSGSNKIDIWGDGNQTRSFMYVDDCMTGIDVFMKGKYPDPINLGSSELVSINQLVSIVEDIAGVKLMRIYDLDAPQGVRGRNSDNSLIKFLYGWEPSISLRTGLEETYRWIYGQMKI